MPGRSINTGNPNDDVKITGYELDDEANLNLYHANARGYDPILGRFGQIDPAMEYASPYVYVGNKPLNLVDPTGMLSIYPQSNGAHYFPDLVDLPDLVDDELSSVERSRRAYAAYWAGASYSDVWGANRIINRAYSNPEQPDPTIPDKINYHSSTQQEIIDQILAYLIFMQSAGLSEGNLLNIFDYTTSTGSVKGGRELAGYGRGVVKGSTTINVQDVPIEIHIGTPSSSVISDAITTFSFPSSSYVPRGTNIRNYVLYTPDRIGYKRNHTVLLFSLRNNISLFYNMYIRPSSYGIPVR